MLAGGAMNPKIEYKIGDCLELMQELDDNSVNLVIADPPYNIGKDHWDNIPDYVNWCINWINECQRVLADNGSFYMFHSDMEQLAKIITEIDGETNFIFKQMIVWNKRFKGSKNKGFLDGYVEVNNLKNYQQMAEYCLFYTFQDETGLSKIQGNCVYPIRDYIRNEILKAKGKIIFKEINTVLGTATNGGGVASAVLSLDKKVPAMITKEHYLKLREWLNSPQSCEYLRQEYEYLRQEYEYLRQEYEDLRYTFNNQKTHHSVWEYEIESCSGHVTPKPVSMIKNIILHSSNPGDTILDPFLGSGTTLRACRETNRNGIGFELNKEYEPIIRKRIMADIPSLDRWQQ
jgi:site-specific DNA-methyltransferase (adenine-specific)